jgi:glutamate/tyrosine decarboxylase-like PLP-dependent enzyme
MIDLSPEEFRQLGYRAIDIITERLAGIRDTPVRQPVPEALRDELMHTPLTPDGINPADLLETVAETILNYPMGNSSPRFFAWVNSTAAPLGILAELLAAANNASVAGGDHSATYVEHGVLNWLKGFFGYPESAGGILTSGGSTANLIPLAVMRHVKAQGKLRNQGFNGETAPMVVYTSAQGHSCIQKTVELLGIGNDYLRRIPTDPEFRIDVAALKAQIDVDRTAGLYPVCVAASAGTVNTGAIDPLDALADLCETEGLWLHVDGAYGGFGILSEQVAPLYRGIERADSIAIDPHKWLYVPIECGCALVKEAQAMRDTFSVIPSYLRDDRVLPWFAEFGIQQTRSFRALKLWMVLQQVGEQGYRDLITRDIDLSHILRTKIKARPDFELGAAGPLSICCFIYHPESDVNVDVDELNRQLLKLVQASGEAFLTGTELNGRFVLRVCIVNFRTTEADLDRLLDVLAHAGQQVLTDLNHPEKTIKQQ